MNTSSTFARQQSSRQDIGDQVRRQVQQAMQQASKEMERASRDMERSGQVVAGTPTANQRAIDVLQAQIAAEKATIDKLTGQLVPGLSDAREEAINSQLEDARDRLQSLQGQLNRALGVPEEAHETAQREFNFDPSNAVPPEVIPILGIVFGSLIVIVLGFPIVRVWARRAERKMQGPPAPAVDPSPRLDRIEQAIEAVAIEVERISEGQRFTTKLMSEMRGLPAPNALSDWKGPAARQAEPAERGGAKGAGG